MFRTKIKAREELQQIVEKLKKQGKTIVTTNGSFDLLHMGHVETFVEAKKQGDVLIVGVNSDASVKRYKSPDRPMVPEEDRAGMIASLICVDYVTIFDEDDPRALLSALKPHVHVKSKSGYKGIEEETVVKHGGKIVLLDDVPGKSTTQLIEKILKVYGK